MNRDMAQVQIALKQIEDLPAAGIRQFNIECNGNRFIAIGKFKYFAVVKGNDRFQAVLMSRIDHDLREAQIVFDDQDDFIGSLDIASVIARLVDHLIDKLEIFDLAFGSNDAS